MARVACRGQVQPVTVQSKAVRSRKKVRSVDSKIFRNFGISEGPLFPSSVEQTVVQMNPILNDYFEAAIMLDCNDREVAAAWY